MNQKDLCILGLLALAFVYLDSRSEGHMDEDPVLLNSGQPLALLPPARPTCPRVAAHPVIPRGDGALWCRTCDEGFFPNVPEWDRILAGAAYPALGCGCRREGGPDEPCRRCLGDPP